jgi:membrane-associated phospholipid phosphatase
MLICPLVPSYAKVSEVHAVADPIPTFQKIKFFTIISILGTVLYFAALHSTRSASVIPATALDNLIPFEPWFVAAYFSFFVFMPLTLVFVRDYQEFIPAAFGFFIIVVVSNTIFLVWPTVIPPGAPYHPLLHGLFAVDRDRNACPSLHASLALYCALIMQRHASRKLIAAALWVWAMLIIASPLLIKRHMLIDIVCGLLFAALVYFSLPSLRAGLIQRLRP